MTNSNVRRLRTAAVFLVLGGLLSVGLRAPEVRADAKATIKEIKEFDKDGDGGKGVAALAELANDESPEAAKALLEFAEKAKTSQIAVKALQILSARKDEGLQKKLKGLIQDKKDYAKEDPDRFIAILDAAKPYGDPKLAAELLDKIKNDTTTNSSFVDAAVHACTETKDKGVVDGLIKLLPPTETRSNSDSTETKEHKAKSKAAILDALAQLTGLEWADHKQWSDYWKENGKKFEFPTAEESGPVDWANLREYTDATYHYHVKLPDMKFPPKEEGDEEFFAFEFTGGKDATKFIIVIRDDTSYECGKIEFLQYKASASSANTPEKMVEHLVKTAREEWISEFSKEPETETRKIGGRDWVVAQMRGMAKGPGWGAVERRVYCTQEGNMLFYAISLLRSGMLPPDPVGEATLNILEGIEFPSK